MSYTIWELLLIFFAYAVLGWAGTVAADAFRTGRFINAGTLNGPVNLTCGAVLTLTATLSDRYATNFVGLFLLAAMVITAAGPIAGFLSERVLGRKLWDYASGEYNTFNGWRGLVRTLIATALALIVVLFLHPYLYIAIQLIPLTVLRVVDIVLLAVLGLDLMATFAAMRTIRRRESDRLAGVSASLQDVRMTWGSRLVSAIRRRLWRAFPELEDEPNRGDGFGRPAEGRVFARGLCIHKLFWVFLICALLGDLIETVFVWATSGVLMSRSSLLYGTFSVVWGLGGRAVHHRPVPAERAERPLRLFRGLPSGRRLRIPVQRLYGNRLWHRVLGLQRHALQHPGAHQPAVHVLLGRDGPGVGQGGGPGVQPGH